ncbi:MAG: hypothetical protein JSV09_13440 [Thermoplasmata archaeon]|nr:MAG: hypothetical protein JSV09_13440 [Thermoplasmata archaeon]
MEKNDSTWFLVLNDSSLLSKTKGAYRLKTIMKLKEVNTLSNFSKS